MNRLNTPALYLINTNIKPELRTRLVLIYTSFFSGVGLLISILAILQLPDDLTGFLIFALMAAVAENFSAELFASTHGSRVSIAGIITFAATMVFGPLAGALIDVVIGVVTALKTAYSSQADTVQKRASFIKRAAFNIGMFVTSTVLSGYIYILVGGQIGKVSQLSNLIPLAIMVMVHELLNISILIGVLSIQTSQNPYLIWKDNFLPVFPIGVLSGIMGGGLLAFSYQNFGMAGLLIFFLPVLTISYSLRIYTSNMRMYVDELEQLNKDLDEANLGLLKTLGAVIDSFDIYTYGHSAQVAVYAAAIAEKMKLPRQDIDELVKAALVHDIGKVGISETIIGKEGTLTTEEYTVVKSHAVIGSNIVGQMKGLQSVASMVRNHHERWDGKGYPDQLKGEKIPVSVRILTLADTLDTLFSDRPYRPTRSFNEVLAEIERCSGTQFDPHVVQAFFELTEERGSQFFKNSALTVDDTIGSIVKNKARYLKKSMVLPKS